MADLTITAGNVRLKSASRTKLVTAGEAITQGMPVWADPANSGKYYKSDCDDAARDELDGICLTPADADGDPMLIIDTVGAQVDIGATTTRGEIYVVSGNAGGVAPEGDLAGTDKVLIVGVATDTAGTLDLVLAETTATLS